MKLNTPKKPSSIIENTISGVVTCFVLNVLNHLSGAFEISKIQFQIIAISVGFIALSTLITYLVRTKRLPRWHKWPIFTILLCSIVLLIAAYKPKKLQKNPVLVSVDTISYNVPIKQIDTTQPPHMNIPVSRNPSPRRPKGATIVGIARFIKNGNPQENINITEKIYGALEKNILKDRKKIYIEKIRSHVSSTDSYHHYARALADSLDLDVLIWGSWSQVNQQFLVKLNIEIMELDTPMLREIYMQPGIEDPKAEIPGLEILNDLSFEGRVGNELASISCFAHAMAKLSEGALREANAYLAKSETYAQKVRRPSDQFKDAFGRIKGFKDQYSLKYYTLALQSAIDTTQLSTLDVSYHLGEQRARRKFQDWNRYLKDSSKTSTALQYYILANSIISILGTQPSTTEEGKEPNKEEIFHKAVSALNVVDHWEDIEVQINEKSKYEANAEDTIKPMTEFLVDYYNSLHSEYLLVQAPEIPFSINEMNLAGAGGSVSLKMAFQFKGRDGYSRKTLQLAMMLEQDQNAALAIADLIVTISNR